MKYKKIMLAAIVLLAILTIGAVSASDDADNITATEIGGDDLDVNQSSFDDEILSSEDVAVVGDDDDGDGEGEDLHYVDIYNTVNTDVDDNVIEYWFNENCTGTVAFLLNDTEIFNNTVHGDCDVYLSVDDLELYKLGYGIFNAQFVYSGDQNHNGFTVNDTMELTYTFSARLDTDDEDWTILRYGNSAYYYVNLPDDFTGNLVYIINGREYNVSCADFYEGVTINAEDIAYGRNNVIFKYVGEDYPLKTINYSFTSLSKAYFPRNINYDETLYVTATLPKDADGYLEVYEVNRGWEYNEDTGDEYVCNFTLLASGKVSNGSANVSISNLSLGTHYLYVNYTGDYEILLSDWCSDPRDMEYDVFVNVRPIFTVPDRVWINGTGICEFKLPEKYNGRLEVTIEDDEKVFDVVDGYASFELFNMEYFRGPAFEDGGNVMYLYYRYVDNETAKIFSGNGYVVLMRESPEFSLQCIEDYISQVVVKNHEQYYMALYFPEYANGNVTIYFDNEYYDVVNVNYGDCVLGIDVDNMTFGKHEARFEYSGDGYFTPSTAYDSFNVSYVDFLIPEKVIIGEYDFGHYNNHAIVLISEGETGVAKLLVDGVEVETQLITDSNTFFDLYNLTYGNHTITVAYENGNYPPVNKTSRTEAKYEYELQFDDLIYGSEDAVVRLPIGASGVVKANIAGKEFIANIDENGTARFDITGILAGDYLATVSYAGDDIYPADSQTFNVTVVYEIIYNFDDYSEIYVGDLANCTIDLALPANATGKLIIYKSYWDYDDDVDVYNELASKDLVNGKAQISLEEVFDKFENKFRSIDIYARYVGDDYDVPVISFYEIRAVDISVTGPQNGENIILGEDVSYTIRLYGNRTGHFKVTGGDRYRIVIADNIPIIDDVAEITVPASYLGLQSFRFTYVDNEFESVRDIFVEPLNVTLADVVSNGKAILTVEMPSDASGNLTAYLCCDKYPDELVLNSTYNGSTATIYANDMPNGIWSLNYFVIEDEKYGRYNFASTSRFHADGFYGDFKIKDEQILIDANLTASANDVKEGEVAVIDISINANATGKVTVNGSEVAIDNGKGKFEISNLTAGTYTYTVAFAGDSLFLNDTATVSFSVAENPVPVIPVSADLTATASDIKEGEVAVIDISINANATGKVTVDGSDVAIDNGKGKFEISNLTAGTYTYTVAFAGDALFLNDTATVSFTVAENQVAKDPVITAKDATVLYTANGKFSVTVYGTDGKAANGAEVVFKVNGKQVDKVKANSNGVATYTVKQTPGTYKISATALGKTVTKKLTVKHLVTLKKVKVKKSAKKLVLQATLAKVNGKFLKNKKITFKFNGKKYTAKTNKKGVAKVTIKSKVLKKLKVGKKVTYQATYLKDTVKKTVKVKK